MSISFFITDFLNIVLNLTIQASQFAMPASLLNLNVIRRRRTYWAGYDGV
ncbi:hypothetical protein [Aliikangiella maris]|uniref:Uncharacterized protein n=2 Tax=Aliikangiella maris TaxID=3162458 RepID=A0ABV3MHZ9_9GAMM